MKLTYTNSLLRIIVSKICQDVGWHSAHISALNVLSDVFAHYIQQISVSALQYANHAGRSQPTFEDLAIAFNHLKIDLNQLQNYISNVDSSPLDIKVPFYPLSCRRNRVLDRTEFDEERAEYYYDWLPSLKSKAIEMSPKTFVEKSTEEIMDTPMNDDVEQKESNGEAEKMDVVEDKVEAEKDTPDEENKKKLVFKFTLGKSEDALPEGENLNDPAKENLNQADSITNQLLSSRAYLKFIKSSLFTNPDDEDLIHSLKKPDTQRLPNNYQSRENSPEPDLTTTSNLNVISPNNDPVNNMDIDLKKLKSKELNKARKKNKNKENDLTNTFDNTFGLAIKPNIKVKEIGLKKEKKTDGKVPKTKKLKNGSKLNIKVTGFGLADDNKHVDSVEVKKEIDDSCKSSNTPKKRKYVKKERPPDYVERRGRKPKNPALAAAKNELIKSATEAAAFEEKNSLLSPPAVIGTEKLEKSSKCSIENIGDNDYNAAKALVFMSESHDASSLKDDDLSKKKPDSISSSEDELISDYKESSKTQKKSAKPSTKRTKVTAAKKIVKSAEVVESSDDSSSDGPDVDANSLSSLKFSELDAAIPLVQPNKLKRRLSNSSLSSMSDSSISSKSISMRSTSNDVEIDSLKSNKKSKTLSTSATPMDLSKSRDEKSKDLSAKHKKNKKHSKEKHRVEKSHKKHKKLKEREKDSKEKVKEGKDTSKPKLSIKLGGNTNPNELASHLFDECIEMNANIEPPINVEFPKYVPKGEETRKKRGQKSKKVQDPQNDLVDVSFIKDKDSGKSKDVKKVVKASLLFESSDKPTKSKVKETKIEKASLLDVGKKAPKSVEEKETKHKSKQKDLSFTEDVVKLPSEKKKEKVKDESKQVKKNESKSCTVVRETIKLDDRIDDKMWICPKCNMPDDGTPMIGCDTCDKWYHYICVGILEEPKEDESWFCPPCIAKQKKKLQKLQKKQGKTKSTSIKGKSELSDSVTITPIPLEKYPLEPELSAGLSLLSKTSLSNKLMQQNVTITPTTMNYKPTGRPRGRPRKDSAQSSSKTPSLSITQIPDPYLNQYPLQNEPDFLEDPYHNTVPSTSSSEYPSFMFAGGGGSGSGNRSSKSNTMEKSKKELWNLSNKEMCPQCRVWMDAPMIGCDRCDQWYHWHCVGINNAPSPDSTWLCGKCRKVNTKQQWKDYHESDESDEVEMSLTDTKFLAATNNSISKSKTAESRKHSLTNPTMQTWRCGTCHIESTETDNEQWIGCDECDKWYHFICAGVTSIPSSEESWFCRTCIEKQASIVNKIAKIKRI